MNVGVDPGRPAGRARRRISVAVAGVSIMFVATTVTNAANYLYVVVLGRIFGPATFGEYSAIFAVLVILSLLGQALQTVTAGRAAGMLARGGPDARADVAAFALRLGRLLLGVGFAAGALWLAFSPLLARVLGGGSTWTVAHGATALLLAFSVPVLQGAFQGAQRFVALGLNLTIMSVGRIVIGVPLVLAGAGVPAAIDAQGAAALVAGVIAVVALRRDVGAGEAAGRSAPATVVGPSEIVGLVRAAGLALAGIVAWVALTNLDVVLVKAASPAVDAGLYSAAAYVGKVALFAPMAVAVVIFPAASARVAASRDPTPVLRRAGRIVAALGVVTVVLAELIGPLVLRVMFGSGYADAAPLVVPLVIGAVGYALVNVYLYYHLAVGRRAFVWILVGAVAVQAAAIVLVGGDPRDTAWIQAGLAWLLVAVNEVAFTPILRPPRLSAPGPAR